MDENVSRGRAVKCEGRFGSIRDFLHEEAVPVVLGDKTMFSWRDLQDLWELTYPEILVYENHRDPYFENSRDPLRISPPDSGLALLPLFDVQIRPDLDVMVRYGNAMGCDPKVSEKLFYMGMRFPNALNSLFGRDSKDIKLPSGKYLKGYSVGSNLGIGSISQGGTKGGGIRSDSPFLLEVYRESTEGETRGERDLAGVIGFWPQNNDMLVSQMQSCRNAHYPEGEKFGVVSLRVAEVFAKLAGFDNLKVYSARNHPQFLAHPDSRGQLESTFECMWDSSAHKLGYEGCSTKNYSKKLPK